MGFDCKDCGAKGFKTPGALGSHRSLACRGKATKRRRDLESGKPSDHGILTGPQPLVQSKKQGVSSATIDGGDASRPSTQGAAESQRIAGQVPLEKRSAIANSLAENVVPEQPLALASLPSEDHLPGYGPKANSTGTPKVRSSQPQFEKLESFEEPTQAADVSFPSFNVDAMPSPSATQLRMQHLRAEEFEDERLLQFVRNCNAGKGLPKKDVAALLNLYNNGFDPRKLHIKTVRQLETYEAEHLHLKGDVSLDLLNSPTQDVPSDHLMNVSMTFVSRCNLYVSYMLKAIPFVNGLMIILLH